MKTRILAVLACFALVGCGDDDKTTSDGAGGAGGAGAEGGAGGAGGGNGDLAGCVDLSIGERCDADESVRYVCDNVFTCEEDGNILGGECYKDEDCQTGECLTDISCQNSVADCVENAGYVAAAECVRSWSTCVEENGNGSEEQCGMQVNECLAALPACE